MPTESNRLGQLILAALLTASLTSLAQAEAPALEPVDPKVTSRLSQELELMKEEETVSIASRYEQPISQAPSNVYVITDEAATTFNDPRKRFTTNVANASPSTSSAMINNDFPF